MLYGRCAFWVVDVASGSMSGGREIRGLLQGFGLEWGPRVEGVRRVGIQGVYEGGMNITLTLWLREGCGAGTGLEIGMGGSGGMRGRP